MNKYKNVLIVFLLGIFLIGAGRAYFGATNFDRLVLGEANFETDPNTSADLTFQNDEYIENGTDGRIGFGAANLLTTGTFGSGAFTGTALSSFDSAAIAGILKTGGATSNGTSAIYIKALSGRLYVVRVYSASGTERVSIDSSGNIVQSGGKIVAFDSLRSQGAFTSNGSATVNNKLVAIDSLRSQGPLTSNGAATLNGATTVNNKLIAVDSLRSQGPARFNGSITVNADVARIDSFDTIGETDTLSWTGAAIGDIFTVNPYLPAYSTTPDTGSSQYGFQVVSAGVVVVSRTKLTPASTLKSGGIYAIRRDGR